MQEIKLQIKKEFSCDVLVVGGGPAGIAAAVASARNGADTILTELNGYLGGTGTAGMVNPFMTSYDTDGKTQIIRGIFDEIVRRMEERGGAIHPSKVPLGTAYAGYRVAGHKNIAPFNAEALKKVSEDMCVESGVRLMYHLMLIDAENENGTVRAAYFATKDGIYKITAKVFIDCTGDADLAVAAGAETIYGDGEGEVQSASLFFSIAGVNKEALDAHSLNEQDMRKKFYMDEIEAERAAGNYPIARNKIMLIENLNGEWSLNMSQVDDVDGTDPVSVTNGEIESRRQIDYIIAFLRKYVAGCENIYLVHSAPALGIRESRRIVGEYELSLSDADESVHFEDTILCCASSLDIHKKGYVQYIARKSTAPYYMPYRSLLAKGISNLMAAGRCASAAREVMGAIRVMPPVFAMGEAAGTGAALAVRNHCTPKEVDAKLLTDTLRAGGAYLG